MGMAKKMNTDCDHEMNALAYDFFYSFSRFEYALKANGYLTDNEVGARAKPDWSSFRRQHEDEYVASPSALEILGANVCIQVVGEFAKCKWEPLTYSRKPSDFQRLVDALNVIRNNLFHGGKSGPVYWDDSERNKMLLARGISVLQELSEIAGIEADFFRLY